jgi:hypothetical protein
MRALLGLLLVAGGLVACATGILVWVAIPRSDTATGSLIVFGAAFVVPGAIAVAVGFALLRRRAT